MSKPLASPPLLTAAIVVRNAAAELEETLHSLRPLADEIVVVDTGSTDATRQVAQQYGVVLLDRPWDNDFSAARNFAWDHAHGRWILWLDAGETLDAIAPQSMREWLQTQADLAQVYLLPIEFPREKNQIAAERIGRVRLAPNLPELRFAGRVAETLLPAAAPLNLSLGLAPWSARRGPRELEPQHKLREARRNIELVQLATEDEGPQSRLLACEGEAWQALGEHARAADCFRHALSLSGRGSTEMLVAFYGLFSALDADPSQRGLQLSLCLQALDIFPLDAQLLCALGGYLQSQGRDDLAARSFETAHRFGQINPGTWHVSVIREIAVSRHAQLLFAQGRVDEAVQLVQRGLADGDPTQILRRQLIELRIQSGAETQALADLEPLCGPTGQSELLRTTVRGACLVAAGQAAAGLDYLQIAYQSGCRDTLCLKYLTHALWLAGEREAALRTFTQWKEIDPARAAMPTGPLAAESVAPTKTNPPPTKTAAIRIDSSCSSTDIRPVFDVKPAAAPAERATR